MVFRDRDLEEWILVGLGSGIFHEVDPEMIIEEAPKTLVNKIPSSNALAELLFQLEHEGLLIHNFLSFRLTMDGKLHYRKFLEPIFQISKDFKNYEKIIDDAEGDSQIKNGFKKLLKKIKDKTPDEADLEFRKFLYELGRDSIWFTVRLVLESLKE